jgi:hypothetical protein
MSSDLQSSSEAKSSNERAAPSLKKPDIDMAIYVDGSTSPSLLRSPPLVPLQISVLIHEGRVSKHLQQLRRAKRDDEITVADLV